MIKDRDLLSIQEVRDLIRKAKEAQERFQKFSQKEIDRIVEAMAIEGRKEAENLAKLAVEETGFGVYKDKVVKNIVATEMVYEFIKDMKTIGVLRRDNEKRIIEIGSPAGVIAAIIPSTNPTSTALYKILISVKSGNAIVLSPHPKAVRCTLASAEVMKRAAIAAGAPEGLIGCMSIVTMEATNELMHHRDVNLILATGGTGLVRAAYSSGKPAYGVGPGNVPAYIESSANIEQAVSDIMESKTFDNGTICASEQTVLVDEVIAERVRSEFLKRKAYFLTDYEREEVEKIMTTPKKTINPAIVGQPAVKIAEMAGIKVPSDTTVLIGMLDGVGPNYPISMEKLSPILGYKIVKDWKEACDIAIQILKFGGQGHTLAIHSNNDDIILRFGLEKPAFRIIVNSPSSQAAIGATTGLDPALTLGCGTIGGTITADNITPKHLINIKRIAYDLRDKKKVSSKTEPAEAYTKNININEDLIKKLVMEVIKEKLKGI